MFNNSKLTAWLTSVSRVSSASLILEDAEGRVLIVKAHYKNYWTFPGGVIDRHETPLQGAVRETREEVGLTVDPATVSFGWVANRTSKQADTYQFVFRAALPADAEARIKLQSSEIEDYAFVTRDEIETQNRHYGKVLFQWVRDARGYVEQSFNSDI
ncbi:MAG TPA: NUDIX hydrolase [Candidatus Saccharimonadales bacterium]